MGINKGPRRNGMILMALTLFATSAFADPLVYVVSADITGNGRFGTVDLTTGAFQQIGPAEPDGYFGLAHGPNGSLVSFTYASNLNSINPATGVPTRVGPTGLPGCVIPISSCSPTTAFSLGGFDGKIYATDFQSNLYVISALTGTASLLSQNTGLPASPSFPGRKIRMGRSTSLTSRFGSPATSCTSRTMPLDSIQARDKLSRQSLLRPFIRLTR